MTLFSDMNPSSPSNGTLTAAECSESEPQMDGSPICMCGKGTSGCSIHPNTRDEWIASHAGFPCTDISRAGNQAGVGEGTRIGLYREVLRIADIVRPRYLFLENVAAILANEFLGTVLGDMAARGYDARWTCVPASAAGAGHYRDRWWLLADNADVDDTRELQPQGSKQNEWRWPDHAAKNATDTMCARLQVGSRKSTAETIPYIWAPSDMVSGEGSGTSATPWFAVEPDVGPLVYGLADDMVPGAIKALGNAQVPLQAALAWMMLGGAIDSF